MYKSIIRPVLFWFDPERVHHFTFSLISIISKIPGVKALFRGLYCLEDKRLEKELFGLKFKNPVGLAAGFDKNAVLFNELANFGFGFIEIGTVTPKAQPGNPKKRLFRLKNDQGIINRMGFNNEGVHALVERLKKGNESAFGELIDEFQQKVFHTCISFVPNKEDAEDVVQEVFLEVYKSIHKFKGNSKLSTWVYKICTNKCLEFIRKKNAKKRFAFMQSITGNQIPLDKTNFFTEFNHPGILLENNEHIRKKEYLRIVHLYKQICIT